MMARSPHGEGLVVSANAELRQFGEPVLRSSTLRTVRVLLTLALGVVGPSSLACNGADASLCANRWVADYPSPDGRLKVVVFERDCGATTGYSTQASILDVDAELGNSGGNTVIADTNRGASPSGPGGGPELRVRWDASDRVVVAHDHRTRLFRTEARRESVAIRYEAF